MEQLPLAVRPPDHAVFASFYAGHNDALVHALREAAEVDRRCVIWLWGPAACGRSHLLKATVAAADQAGRRAACLPLATGLPAGMLEGLETLDLLCLDDVDQIAGNADWERALFILFEALRQRGARLVMSAARTPLHVPFALPDLASRLASGATWRVRPLDDEQRAAALSRRAAWRGLELPAETAVWLLQRVDRSLPGLFQLLDELDLAALAARKRLTIPFVREILGQAAGGDSGGH